jgi:very-short-patch-repair endonuclease
VQFGPRPVDREIAARAREQYGVVSARQLTALGLSQQAISRRVAAGRLHRVHHGVYAVGHVLLTRSGRWMAAVLACGPDAALSHASAAALWAMQRGEPTIIDVTTHRTGRKRPGLRPRHPAETTTHHAIPVTTPARTILDLAATVTRTRLEHLLDQAELRELTDYPSLDALARAHPGHRGSRELQQTLTAYYAGSDIDRSDLEILFAELCANNGLPSPRINHPVAGKAVDFLFTRQRLIVEIDSWRYHKTRRAFENDRARDVLTTQAGYRTLRFTDRHLTRQPHAVAHAIQAVLADRRAA